MNMVTAKIGEFLLNSVVKPRLGKATNEAISKLLQKRHFGQEIATVSDLCTRAFILATEELNPGLSKLYGIEKIYISKQAEKKIQSIFDAEDTISEALGSQERQEYLTAKLISELAGNYVLEIPGHSFTDQEYKSLVATVLKQSWEFAEHLLLPNERLYSKVLLDVAQNNPGVTKEELEDGLRSTFQVLASQSALHTGKILERLEMLQEELSDEHYAITRKIEDVEDIVSGVQAAISTLRQFDNRLANEATARVVEGIKVFAHQVQIAGKWKRIHTRLHSSESHFGRISNLADKVRGQEYRLDVKKVMGEWDYFKDKNFQETKAALSSVDPVDWINTLLDYERTMDGLTAEEHPEEHLRDLYDHIRAFRSHLAMCLAYADKELMNNIDSMDTLATKLEGGL